MEDSPPTRRRNITRFDQLESMFEGAMENPDLPHVLTDNVENLLFVWSALIQSKGQPGWLASAKDALGNPIFDAAEAAKIELQITPFASALLSYSCGNKQSESAVQQGGGEGGGCGARGQAGGEVAQANVLNRDTLQPVPAVAQAHAVFWASDGV